VAIRAPAIVRANGCLIIDNEFRSAATTAGIQSVIANSTMAEGDNMSDFYQILTSLLSTDNNVRQTAEVN